MKYHLKVQRFDPERDKSPYYAEYELEMEPGDKVVDALNKIKWEIDGSLAFRRSCVHGVCGSDAMRINGLNRLACKLLLKDVSGRNGAKPIVIQPLLGFKVIRDLVVDLDPFFAAYKNVKPYLINNEPAPGKEFLQSPGDRERFDDTTKCILCAACTTSCPSFWSNDSYIGPAAIVAAHRFIFDSRDRGLPERMETLDSESGVWRCHTIFNCVDACPRGINVTKAIGEVKRLLQKTS